MKKTSELSFLLKSLKKQTIKLTLLTVLIVSTIGLQLVNPQIMKKFIDGVLNNIDISLLWRYAVIFIGISIMFQIISLASNYLSQRIAWLATNDLRESLVKHSLKLPISFFNNKKTGELIERLDGDISRLTSFFSDFTIRLFSSGILIIGILFMLFRENIYIGCAFALFTVISVILLLQIRKIATPFNKADREAESQFHGMVGENIEASDDLSTNGAEAYSVRKFVSSLKKWFPITRNAQLANYTMFNSSLFIFAIGNSIALASCYYLWTKGMMTIGTIYLIFNYTEYLRRPIEQLRTQLENFQRSSACIKRIAEIVDLEEEKYNSGAVDKNINSIKIEFRNLSFSYDGNVQVLNDVNFTVSEGKKIGIIGKTGSGKTTLARLIARIYDPPAKTLFINDNDILSYSVGEVRRQIGYVTQDIELFKASIRDNITFFDKTVQDEQITKLLTLMGLGQWLTSLPDGLDTIYKGEGGGASAGEAQLIAFARLFVKNPNIVIFDEASSFLDPVTEQMLDEATEHLLRGKTSIIIAHKLKTIQKVDDILVLKEGNVIEYGPRTVLEKNPVSEYYKLLQSHKEIIA